MKKGNDIDNFFREGLEQPDIPFNDAHWQAMEERLHPKPKRRIAPVIWFAALSGLAAVLLIIFFVNKPADKKPYGSSEKREERDPAAPKGPR
ncbi:MAG: hypothetical protein EOP53_21990, partial [Sphingobacteriales bacterium]